METLRRWLEERPQGTLMVAAGFAGARRLLEAVKDCTPDLCLGALPEDLRAFNALCVCPASGNLPRGYDRVVLAGAPEEWAAGLSGVEVFRLAGTSPWPGPMPSLGEMRDTYRALMRVTRRPAWCRSLGQLARVTAEEAGLEEVPVTASLLAMTDMGLFSLALDEQPVAVRRSDRAKASPEDSAVWRAIQRWCDEAKG